MNGRIWDPLVTLGAAVGISMDGYARHQLINYEKLLNKARLSRDEAREHVQPRINEIIASWRRPQVA